VTKIPKDQDYRRSRWGITINSNKAVIRDGSAKEQIREYDERVDEIMSRLLKYVQAFTWEEHVKVGKNGKKKKVKIYTPIPFKKSMIKNPRVETGTEIGPKYHKLHSHSEFEFKHLDMYRFRLDVPRLKRELRPWNILVKYRKDDKFDQRHYIRKNQPEE
jgi:hypothetical protein